MCKEIFRGARPRSGARSGGSRVARCTNIEAMGGDPPSLAASFYGSYRGGAPAPGEDQRLEPLLRGVADQGRAAWPGVILDDALLAGRLGALAPADVSLASWLGGLQAADLYLACACAERVPDALRAFDAAFLGKLDLYLRALHPTSERVAETKQLLLEKLFVGTGGRPPTILQYGGRGALEGWVRVSAVRTALHLVEKERAGPVGGDDADAIARAFVPDRDPELELIRASYQADFSAAFREAVLALSRRDRSLLRFTFVERLTPDRIAVMYGVHRTTTMRWISAAQEEVLAGTRARMMNRLRLSPSDCDAIFALVRSRVDVTLGSLLGTGS